LFKKTLSILASTALAFTGVVALGSTAQATQEPTAKFTSVSEQRVLALNSNFRAEADEKSAKFEIRISFTAGQYGGLGSGKQLTFRAYLKNGASVVSRENYLFSNGALSGPVGGNTIITDGQNASLQVTTELRASLLSSVDYQLDLEVLLDGVEITGFSVDSVKGVFEKTSQSITSGGDEEVLSFVGISCLSEGAYSSLQPGDVIEFTVTDTSSRNYQVNFANPQNADGMGGNPFVVNGDGVRELELTSAMLADKFLVQFEFTSPSPTAGIYDPAVSIKKDGTGTELSTSCAGQPDSAPTVSATATGISATIDLTGARGGMCYLADADHPNVPLMERFVGSASQPTCFFSGIKRGDYVVWYEKFTRLSDSSFDISGLPSPISPVVSYLGGNSTFRTFTGTSGGSGQGSLSLSDISYVGSDFGTEFRSGDGNGGVLVGTIDAGVNEYVIRQLTTSGMSSTFGGGGEVVVNLPLYNQRNASSFSSPVSLGWFGPDRDKWVAVLPSPPTASSSFYGVGALGPSELIVIATGNYANSTQVVSTLSNLELAKFCRAAVTGADNSAWSFSGDSRIRQVVSAPAADPLFIVECSVRHGATHPYSTSQVPFLASFDGTEFGLKAKLGEEPNSAEKCSRTIFSAPNSGATGSEVMLAAYQTTWNPSSGSECWLNAALPSANVVSRDVITITSSYARTVVSDVLTVGATEEPGVFFGFMGMSRPWQIIVSGSNTHLLAPEVVGDAPNQRFKYRVARLNETGGFGSLESLPYLSVGSSNEFLTDTRFSQIADYSETEAGSFLISRNDFSTGSTAARVDLATGALTNYQQMASTFGSDGGSLILGNSSGDLNFFGITSRTTAVLGQWVTTGAFDPALADLPINQGAENTGVSNPNQGPPPQNQNQQQAPASSAPFTGPTLDTPAIPSGVRAGSSVTIPGSNLSGVTKVEIGGLDAQVKVNSAGELEIVVPAGLAAGTYDIVLTSSEGRVTVQSAITIRGGAGLGAAGESRPSTKRMDDSSAKVYFYGAVGAGKIQFMLNGREIAWVNATDASDRKLTDGYLVRTVTLEAGKNVIEVLVDGVQVRRTVYSN
jgi:hypothetical protein